MKTTHILSLAIAGALLSGCANMPSAVTPMMATAEYSAKEPIATSLFPSDLAILGEEAVARILSSKLELPAKAKLALMKFPDVAGSRNYGRYYWRDEEYLKVQQEQVDTLSKALLSSDQIAEVSPLPSLMVGSDTYWQYRAFAKDKAKAYSTCELVLLDVRTGLVPFTRVVSRERLELKQSADLDLSETMRRAEQASAAEALKVAADDLVDFVKLVPRKGN